MKTFEIETVVKYVGHLPERKTHEVKALDRIDAIKQVHDYYVQAEESCIVKIVERT